MNEEAEKSVLNEEINEKTGFSQFTTVLLKKIKADQTLTNEINEIITAVQKDQITPSNGTIMIGEIIEKKNISL